MLVPVIGLVQVGRQAMADRYTYLPVIGVFIAIAYAARDIRFGSNKWQVAVAVAVLAGCIATTYAQLGRWKDSKTLFTHTVAVTGENPVARVNLGVALEEAGQTNAALTQYREALRLDPGRPSVHNNIANVLAASGQQQEALLHYREALRLKPNAPLAHLNLGTTLIELGQHEDGMRHYAEASRLAPGDPRGPYLMGKALLKQGESAAAIAQLERANGLTGGRQPFVLDALGMAYAEAGRFEEAQRAAQAAIDVLAHTGSREEATAIQARLELYRSRQPYREPKRQ
jgi:protein O-mannosyl-transferase